MSGVGNQVKQRLLQKGEEAFKKLKKIFLGAINTLDEDTIAEDLEKNKSLIDAGYLDLNQSIKDNGSTLLHTAVWYRKLKLVKFLVEHGADPNRINQKGNSPLHFACENADKDKAAEIVALLMRHGADPLLQNHADKSSPYDKAVGHGARDLLEQLIKEQRIARGEDADAPLPTPRPVSEPLQSEADPFSPRNDVPTPRDASIADRGAPKEPQMAGKYVDQRMKQRAEQIMGELIKLFNGDDLEQHYNEIRTLLEQNADLVDQKYVDINASTNNTNSTFLHTAVWYMKPSLIKWLLEHGADPNCPNLKGNTPLHFASQKGEEPQGKEVLELLLEAGGDLYVKNYTQFRSPLESASPNIRTFLTHWKPSGRQPTFAGAAPSAHAAKIDSMIEAAAREAAMLDSKISNNQSNQDNAFQQKLAQGKGSKVSKMIDKALEGQKRLDSVVDNEQQAQEEAWKTKLAQGRKKGGELGNEAKEKLEQLAKDMASVDVALQRAQEDQNEDFMSRLKKGRKQRQRNGDEHGRTDSLDITTQLLQELDQQHQKTEANKSRERDAAEDDLMKKIAAKRKQKKDEPQDDLGVHRLFATLDTTCRGHLTEQEVIDYHRDIHSCRVPSVLVRHVVGRVGGKVTKQLFLRVLQSIHATCLRYETLYWDFKCFDVDNLGSLRAVGNGETELLWSCNITSDTQPRYKDWLQQRHDTAVTSRRRPNGEPASGEDAYDDVTFDDLVHALLLQ